MNKKIFVSIVLFALISFLFMGIFNIIPIKQKKLTVEESFIVLLNDIYKGKDYFPLCTVYNSANDGAQDTTMHSVRYPAYEFELPNNLNNIRRQIYCYGETKDGNYFIFFFFSWHYFYNEGQREYTHANYVSSYAVNRITQEIIQERVDDDTKPEYIASQEFMDIVGMNYSNVIEKRSYD